MLQLLRTVGDVKSQMAFVRFASPPADYGKPASGHAYSFCTCHSSIMNQFARLGKTLLALDAPLPMNLQRRKTGNPCTTT